VVKREASIGLCMAVSNLDGVDLTLVSGYIDAAKAEISCVLTRGMRLL
jgi:hypothetical protein